MGVVLAIATPFAALRDVPPKRERMIVREANANTPPEEILARC
jgi:hypothetical protein